MTTMVLARSNRARQGGVVYCHDDCDPNLTPRGIKKVRRQVKRSERQKFKASVRQHRFE